MDDTPESDFDDATPDEGLDAIGLLAADHETVRTLFEAYEDLADRDADEEERQALADRICALLTVHATLEEEIFYPAARQALEEQELLDDAEAEHAEARQLIDRIEESEPSEEGYDDRLVELSEMVEKHVAQEEGDLFPTLADSGTLDLQALGAQLAARRQELMAEVGLEQDA